MKKLLALLLVAAMALALVACTNKPVTPDNSETPANTEQATEPTENNGEDNTPEPTEEVVVTAPPRPETYERFADEDIYYRDDVLAKYSEMMEKAHAAATPDEAFVLYAQAEANLLASGVMIPTTTQGGAYQISRIAYRTVPYVQWGNDDDRLHGLVVSDEFLTHEERDELITMSTGRTPLPSPIPRSRSTPLKVLLSTTTSATCSPPLRRAGTFPRTASPTPSTSVRV